jgi:hypothetical protein
MCSIARDQLAVTVMNWYPVRELNPPALGENQLTSPEVKRGMVQGWQWWSGEGSNLNGTSRPRGYSPVPCRMGVHSMKGDASISEGDRLSFRRLGVTCGIRTRDGGVTIHSLDHLANVTPKRPEGADVMSMGLRAVHDGWSIARGVPALSSHR